jgi:Plavaka transposase
MNYKCPFCPRTFSQRSAYSQHVQICMKKVEVEENIETPVDLQDDINDINDINDDVNDINDDTEYQDTSFSSMESVHSNILSEISIMSYEDGLKAVEESEESGEFEGESDIFEESNVPKYTDFPNEAYKDLMILVTKHKLNNKAGNAIIKFFNKHSALSKSPLPKNIEKGRTFMNNMNFPNLTFNKICIAHYNSKQYFLHYQNLIQCVKNILTIPDITQNFALSYENHERGGENVYKEQNNGIWWKNTEASLPMDAKLLSLILYSDATTTDTLGKSQLHPIYLSIGNIPMWRRNKSDAKQLLGYLPILEAASGVEKKSSAYKNLVRETFHKSLHQLLEPIISLKDGVDLSVNNEIIWFYPRVSTIITDWPEAASFCLVYKSPNSTLPCHFCLVKKDDLANINLPYNDVVPRTHNEMRGYLENNTPNSACIESVPNFFWELP